MNEELKFDSKPFSKPYLNKKRRPIPSHIQQLIDSSAEGIIIKAEI